MPGFFLKIHPDSYKNEPGWRIRNTAIVRPIVPGHWKPLKAMVERPKNHWCQWPETKKHSMVIVSSKNVEVYNVFCKIIDISNVLCKLHIISCILQYRFWCNGRTDNTFFPFMQACVSLQVEFTHFLLHWIFQTKKLCYHRSAPRQDHCFSINANESNSHNSTQLMQLIATNLSFLWAYSHP